MVRWLWLFCLGFLLSGCKNDKNIVAELDESLYQKGQQCLKENRAEEAAKIAEEIANKAVVTREPCYSSREVTTENNGFGDTYIEIDLSNQHLWYYIDGELYVQSDIVSGTYYTASRRTPAGIFLLTYKQRDKVLRGQQKEDGTYEYESPVSFWMPFNGGIGLHDATWRGSFGGSIYKYSGSHGCINMPYNSVKELFSKVSKGTPIIAYYREPVTVPQEYAYSYVKPETTAE